MSVLWVCHGCEMIGREEAAQRHAEDHGHEVEALSQEQSDAVRAEWRREQAERAAAFMAAAAFTRGA